MDKYEILSIVLSYLSNIKDKKESNFIKGIKKVHDYLEKININCCEIYNFSLIYDKNCENIKKIVYNSETIEPKSDPIILKHFMDIFK